MGKSVKERLTETIKRDKREIDEEGNKMVEKEEKETNVEDFMNEKIKEMIEDKEDMDEEEFEDEFDDKSSNWKKIVVILLVLIISLSTILVLWSNGYEIVNFAVNKVSQSSNQSKDTLKNNTNENIQGEESVQSQQVDINIVYEEVHRMANTIIIPEDGNKWGEDEITKERIEKVLYELNGRDDYLNKELNKWNNSDFSNGVKVHNYVWSKLGGTIGKAKSLNDVNVQKAINLLNN